MSYGLIDDHGWYECIFYYGVVLWCAPSRANVGDPRCRVLQCVHNLPMVGGVSDKSTDPSRWVIAYGSKDDLILNAMVGFYLNDLW